MDHDRLRSWLGLPPSPWPPDHYALLGLPRGSGEFADIEARVLDRMELLRPHQLLHPELVTEGMNRLAQALVCLTDPVARADYNRDLGIPAAPFEVVEDDLPMAEDLPAGTQEVPFKPGMQPPGEPPAYEVLEGAPAYEVVHYEVVEDAPRPKPPPVPPFVVVPESPAPPAVQVPEFLPSEAIPPEPAPASRRALYRRIAAIRRALRAWENLRQVLGNPAESLATPVSVLLFVRALAEARVALRGVPQLTRSPNVPGGAVAALVRLPHALHLARTLLPSQRETIALDWRRGYEFLLRERTRLREMAFVVRSREGSRVILLLRELRRNPEWCLLPLAFVMFLFALFRRNP